MNSIYIMRIEEIVSEVSALKAERRFDEAISILDQKLPDHELNLPHLLHKAEMLYDLRALERAYALYEHILSSDLEDDSEVRYAYARRLYNQGLAKNAQCVLAEVKKIEQRKGLKSYLDKINQLCSLIERLEGKVIPLGQDTRILAMKHAILSFRDRTIVPPPDGKIGKIALCTGTLGAGGAERQLSRLAIELTKKWRSMQSVADLVVDHPVELIIRSLAPARGHDFFLKEVQDGGVDLQEVDSLKVSDFDPSQYGNADFRILLSHLPAICNYGVQRLTPHFLKTRPEFLSVWQDGACLLAGLAALIAGVPRIQLGLRGLPPSMREHLFRPEYELLYQALASIPGVDFMSNNRRVAVEYGKWLNIGDEKFRVVYNGVQKPITRKADELDAIWSEFVGKTHDAEITIGGVFRFAKDKRPNLWVRFAASYLSRNPRARFVLVGGGDLLPNVIALADKLNISDRILFVGASKDVGYWMKKMNVFVLLSRFEGLPNVLIEAQMMGIPVVSTPAGGSAECFIDHVSGRCLDELVDVDLNQVCECVDSFFETGCQSSHFSSDVMNFLNQNFSIEGMVTRFVETIREPASVCLE